MHGLSLRQELFVREYLKTYNASEAYRLAGYKGKHPDQQAAKLVRNGKVQGAIREWKKEVKSEGLVDLNEILFKLRETYDYWKKINPAAALKAVELMGKTAGFFNESGMGSLPNPNSTRDVIQLDPESERKEKLDFIRMLINERSKNAIQIEKTSGVDVREQAKDGEPVGQGNTEHEELTGLQEPKLIAG